MQCSEVTGQVSCEILQYSSKCSIIHVVLKLHVCQILHFANSILLLNIHLTQPAQILNNLIFKMALTVSNLPKVLMFCYNVIVTRR